MRVKRQAYNERNMEQFKDAVYTAARLASQDALMATAKEMVENAVGEAEFNDYSGTLIRSYVAAYVQKHKEKLNENALQMFLKGNRTFKGAGNTVTKSSGHGYNRVFNDLVHKAHEYKGKLVESNGYVAFRSTDLPYVRSLPRGLVKRRRNRYYKKLAVVRSHETPAWFASDYMPNNHSRFIGDQYAPAEQKPSNFFRNMHGAIDDSVVLTNTAPYAQEVHRNWNRVLPASLPEWGKRFYISRLERTIKGK